MHHSAVNHHVVVDELRGARAVGEDPADGAGDEEHVLGTIGLEPMRHLGLVAQIQLLTLGREDVGESLGLEPTHHRRSNQSGMTRDIDP